MLEHTSYIYLMVNGLIIGLLIDDYIVMQSED